MVFREQPRPTLICLCGLALMLVAHLLVRAIADRLTNIAIIAEVLLTAAVFTFVVTPLTWMWLRRILRERQAVESALAKKNADLTLAMRRFRQMREAIDNHAIVAITDPEGTITDVNDAFCRISGFKREELLGQTHRLVNSGYHSTEFFADMWRTIRAGETWHGQLRNRRKDGTFYWVNSTVVPFMDEQGAIETYIAIRYDITDRLHAQHALKQERTVLLRAQEAIRQHNCELEAATAKAEQFAREAQAATVAKAEFLANMSHEIRTPMNAVIGMTDLLLDTSLDVSQREFTETIRTSGDALLAIINDILDFSKIEAGHLELEHTPVNLRDCVESALDLAAGAASAKHLDLLYWIEDDVPSSIYGDITRLRQILINLVGNAVKFTERGEILLSIAQRVSQEEGPRLTISVRDTGIGIPADRINRLFRSFSQADASTTRKYGGTGLGLAISQRLVQLMHGRIWVESTLGQGSTFSFEIALEPAPTAPNAQFSTDLSELKGRRLLLVDDNATNRRILSLQTQRWGLTPRAACSGREALDWLDRGDTFDLAIIDVQMPEMDGYGLAAELRRRCTVEQLPILALTSLGDAGRGFVGMGVGQTLTKPAKASTLYDVIVKLLNRTSLTAAPVVPHALESQLAERIPLRILLAEDNAVNRRVAALILGRMGYRIECVANGLEVLAAVARQSFDIIFMDVQMPEMDGLESTRRLCSQYPVSIRPWIVAMTANAMEGDRETCLANGMDDYVSKPIRAATVAKALTNAAEQLAFRRPQNARGLPIVPGQPLIARPAKTHTEFAPR